jgi:hypothetical protein
MSLLLCSIASNFSVKAADYDKFHFTFENKESTVLLILTDLVRIFCGIVFDV